MLLRAPFRDRTKHGACPASRASAAACPQLQWPLQVGVSGRRRRDAEAWPGGRDVPAFKKDGRVAASSTALRGRGPAAGDWSAEQEEAGPPRPRDFDCGRRTLVPWIRGDPRGLWSSAPCGRRSPSLPPDGGVWTRAPPAAGAAQTLSGPWGRPRWRPGTRLRSGPRLRGAPDSAPAGGLSVSGLELMGGFGLCGSNRSGEVIQVIN